MKHNILLYIIISLLMAGCQQVDDLSSPANERNYNTRVTFQLNLSIKDLVVETTPMESRSATTEETPVATDLWYAVFDAVTNNLVPAKDGRTTRHLTLEDGVILTLEELLPVGDYQLSFLVMTKGGDATAVQALSKRTDSWLKVSANGTVAGDFLSWQGAITVKAHQENTVKIEPKRAVAQLRLNLSLPDAQLSTIQSVTLSVTDGALFETLGADGAYGGTAQVTNIDLSRNRDCFLLAPTTQQQPCKGNVLITLTDKDGKKYQRAYPFELGMKAGERATFNLTLDLPYDALDISTANDMIGAECRMYADTEDASIMQNEKRRAFYLQAPLRVAQKDNTSAYIQFYSPKGIGHTEIYARIKSTKDYFKVYDLDSVKPFNEIVMPSKFLNGKVFTSVTQDGRIVKVPTAGLTWDHVEFLCVNTTSEYWRRFGNGTAKPNFKFRIYGFKEIPMSDEDKKNNYMDVTPKVARRMVAMALNWAHMFSTDIFLEELKKGGPYHIDVRNERTNQIERITSTPEDMYRRVMDVSNCTFVLQHPNAGVYGQGGAGFGMLCISEDQYEYQIPTDKPNYGLFFVKFHEFAHVMGFPDNYGVSGVNTITNYGNVGWPKVCDDIMLQLATDKNLPVTTIKELDTIFN